MKVNWVTVFMDKEGDANAPAVRFSEGSDGPRNWGVIDLFESKEAKEADKPHITLFTKDVEQSFTDFLQNVVEGLSKFRSVQEAKERKELSNG